MNEQFQPGDIITQTQKGIEFFPLGDSLEDKRAFIREKMGEDPIHKTSLYFHCKVYLADQIIFEYQDFFEPNPKRRVHIKWTWNYDKSMGEGQVFFPDDWDKED